MTADDSTGRQATSGMFGIFRGEVGWETATIRRMDDTTSA